MTAEMTNMSCRYLNPGEDRCAPGPRYICNLSKRAEMYGRNGFIGSPIELWGNLQAKMRRVNITTRFLCKADGGGIVKTAERGAGHLPLLYLPGDQRCPSGVGWLGGPH